MLGSHVALSLLFLQCSFEGLFGLALGVGEEFQNGFDTSMSAVKDALNLYFDLDGIYFDFVIESG